MRTGGPPPPRPPQNFLTGSEIRDPRSQPPDLPSSRPPKKRKRLIWALCFLGRPSQDEHFSSGIGTKNEKALSGPSVCWDGRPKTGRNATPSPPLEEPDTRGLQALTVHLRTDAQDSQANANSGREADARVPPEAPYGFVIHNAGPRGGTRSTGGRPVPIPQQCTEGHLDSIRARPLVGEVPFLDGLGPSLLRFDGQRGVQTAEGRERRIESTNGPVAAVAQTRAPCADRGVDGCRRPRTSDLGPRTSDLRPRAWKILGWAWWWGPAPPVLYCRRVASPKHLHWAWCFCDRKGRIR